MNVLALWWISALILIFLTGLIGRRVKYLDQDGKEKDGHWLGILIDDRQRFSLTHMQVVLWTLVLISLLTAIFLARLLGGADANEALNINIPPEILVLAGISGGSAVVATATKATRTEKVRKKRKELMDKKEDETEKYHSRFFQVFMVEEGETMDKVIDVTKFQNFFFTLIAVAAYVIMAAAVLNKEQIPTGFPAFGEHILWLIGISHSAYVGGKFPEKK